MRSTNLYFMASALVTLTSAACTYTVSNAAGRATVDRSGSFDRRIERSIEGVGMALLLQWEFGKYWRKVAACATDSPLHAPGFV